MNNNLKQLIELQKIDSKLLNIEESKGDLPKIVQNLTDQLENAKKETDLRVEEIKEIASGINKETASVDDNNVKLKKLNEQLFLVKSNKEYDALNFEIDHLKELIKTSEDKVIELEEEKEIINDNKENYASEIEDFQKALDEKNAELNTAISNTEKEESELNKFRLEVVDTIDPKFLGTYNRLRKAKNGLGITNLCSDACGVCFTQLPKQTVIEVKEGINIVSCPTCSIYLFFEEEELEE